MKAPYKNARQWPRPGIPIPGRGTCLVILILGGAIPVNADNAVDRVRRHTPRMSWLDNGTIRLGVDLNLGGAITHLSPSNKPELNLVNSHDFGRQIQMSYYSGPVPFTVAGKQPKPEWKFIGWNPIQVGDAFGNPSRLLDHKNDGQKLYVKCVPMHWPLDNVPGECTYECWFELSGNAVLARSRTVNNRPDKTQYPARDQEYPAVYTNGPWHRLMTYTGDQPFTNGPITRIVKKKGEPGMWSDWIATESWAALVDDDDFGLGIWIPTVRAFKGGFAGKPGQGGPQDDPTGYIAPCPREIIDWNITHEYEYRLILGTLTEIRKHVYDRAKRPTPPTWTFEQNRQGWTYLNAADAGWPIRNALDVRLENVDPQLVSPVTFFHARDAATLIIRATARTTRTDASLYWRNLGDQSFTEDKSIPFALLNDNQPQTYRIKLAGHPHWKGPIIQIRLDPISRGAKGDSLVIQAVSFDK